MLIDRPSWLKVGLSDRLRQSYIHTILHLNSRAKEVLSDVKHVFNFLMIFVGVRYSFRAGFCLGVEKIYIEKVSAELASPVSVCFDVKSIVIFSVVVLL